MIEVTDMFVSKKIQNAGFNVLSITGGNSGEKKRHYFDVDIETLEKVKNAGNGDMFSKPELNSIKVVKEIKPTKFPDTGIEEKVTKQDVKKRLKQ